jgi:small-conductance mechanosensitive channel
VKQIYAVSDIMERIYDVLGEKGIQIPFPQRDVHIIS